MQVEHLHIRPSGSEGFPDEQWLQLSVMDFVSPPTYIRFAVVLKTPDDAETNDDDAVIQRLRRSLELSLGQSPHLAGTIELHPSDHDGSDWRLRTTRDSTVALTVRRRLGLPSYAELEAGHFSSKLLFGEGSEPPALFGGETEKMALPGTSPAVLKLDLAPVRGGIVLGLRLHHWVFDIQAFASFVKQWAGNCSALVRGDPVLPAWDTVANAQRPQFEPSGPPVLGGGPSADAHPDHRPCSLLLFHLPPSKAAELKKLASPPAGEGWISSYDAFTALWWRILTRHRARLYATGEEDLSRPASFGETVNLRRRLVPPLPSAYQGVAVTITPSQEGVFSPAARPHLRPWGASPDDPAPTLAEVSSPSAAPLSRLAAYIRRATDRLTPGEIVRAYRDAARVRDRTCLFSNMSGPPPMTFMTSDWRDADVCGADFGAAQAVAFRMYWRRVTPTMLAVYPARKAAGKEGGESDEGVEFGVPVEWELVEGLKNDPEVVRWFEYRGVEAEGVA
ncbi:Omega-hydroxypalmitate O-feruloyl transferase [Pleurostoma richardsiae]|uniref:Omega-hydroxypalmitate O-feruloyl transferase n=1 Tax=Pleurostoma richardsiae TaxID=41990 RepID=A0AA38RB01_9PEZI|nr:Omega-hydroxypalmitate O-feruloyl transferase [Pleurostoma richardsiae]